LLCKLVTISLFSTS